MARRRGPAERGYACPTPRTPRGRHQCRRASCVFLDANGGVWATGNDDASQLGALPPLTNAISRCASSRDCAGTERYSAIPLKVPGLSPAIAIAAGRDRSAAVDRGGRLARRTHAP
ncbi:hypothetical protein XarjCFBP7645_06750 [Xanthomonas arboricola]|uniref:Uncharacterized protein n=1 Tax=Xanthomonas arboricola TaxID=56448 RepID=A0A2S7AJ88_9XANT|nr:hypothetical protein XarjCFBP7645_06750 [Xanthomonas arboricola]